MPDILLQGLLLFSSIGALSVALSWIGYHVADRLSIFWASCVMKLKAKQCYSAPKFGDKNSHAHHKTPPIDNSHLSALIQADSIAANVLAPKSYLTAINLQQALTNTYQSCHKHCELFIDELMATIYPERWLALPAWLQNKCYQHIKTHLKPFLDDVFDDVAQQSSTLFDYKQTLTVQIKHNRPPYTTTLFKCLSAQTQYMGRQWIPTTLLIALVISAFLCVASLWYQGYWHPYFMDYLLIGQLIASAALLAGAELKHQTSFKNQTTKPAKEALKSLLANQLLDIPSQLLAFQHAPKRQCLEHIIQRRIKQWFFDNRSSIVPIHWIGDKHQDQEQLISLATQQCIRGLDIPFDEPLTHKTYQIQINQHLSSLFNSIDADKLHEVLAPILNLYQKTWRILVFTWFALSLFLIFQSL